jgi:hypothetical protein
MSIAAARTCCRVAAWLAVLVTLPAIAWSADLHDTALNEPAHATFATSSPTLPQLKLHVPQGYMPQVPVLVRIEINLAQGDHDRSVWDGIAHLSVDSPGVTLSTNRVGLRHGLGSTLVTFSGSNNVTLTAEFNGLQAQRLMQPLAHLTPTRIGGTLPGTHTTWSGVVLITNDVLVPTDHTLTILPNTYVLLSGVSSGTSAADLEVRGTLLSQGTEDEPITITCTDANLNWGQIRHVNAQPSLYRYTAITKGSRAPGEGHTGTGAAVRATNSKLTFEHCTISDLTYGAPTIGKIMTASGSDVVLDDCLLARARMGPEIDGTALLCTNTWIMDMQGPNDCDGIYVHNQKAGQTILITDCVIAQGDDDGIDTLGSTVTVENCIIREWRNLQEDAKGVSIFNGAADLRRCLITGCYLAVSAKWSSGPAVRVNIQHCTLVSTTNAVSAIWKDNAPGPNIDYRITNSILRGVEAVHTDFGATNFSIGYCNISQSWPGAGNLTGDPLFVNATNDFYLREGSPCINTGDPAAAPDTDGTRADMGAYPFLQTPVVIQFETPAQPVDGRFRLQFTLAPEQSYWLEATTNFVDWEFLTSLPGTSAVGEWTDTNAAASPLRFYRLRSIP